MQINIEVESDFGDADKHDFVTESQAMRLNRLDPTDVAFEDHTGIGILFPACRHAAWNNIEEMLILRRGLESTLIHKYSTSGLVKRFAWRLNMNL